ncbi:right-handed parallel beta-helix repeat-containing protein [Phosphitispora fastidiosa]|uniref:right-handed parallel beta-helix repeat-containing protein n=1 Tax=Phosphitispora fastidiosa TaxID=2837202 RepID=UPI001E58BE20|nr:NosD domain-containing protein [Phosphitispora fastidiosa]MBU7006298.1 parallel beta-helix repeat protein [Phosphitispora fastidiosa]
MAYQPFQMPYRITGDEDLSTLARKINAIMEGLTFYVNQLQVYENGIGVPTNELVEVNKDSWSAVATNFDTRNDRISTVPADPVIAADGSAIDHTINTNGSADISVEWSFDGLGDAYNVDGFVVWVRSGDTSGAYAFGTNPAEETDHYVGAEKRAIIFQGKPANKYYTFGVQAYRMVDQDINADGILKSAIIQPSIAEENSYLPSASVAFAGDVTGTVAGVPGDQISKVGATFIVGDTDTSTNIKRADYVVPTGSTSAQDTINQAINALGAVGGKIELLDGTFMVSGSIVLPSNVTLQGQGNSTVIKAIYTQSVPIAITNSDTVNGNINICVKDILVDGNKNIAQLKGGATGIYFAKAVNCNITDCQVKNFRTYGVYLNESTNNIVSQNTIRDIGITTGTAHGIRLYVNSEGNIINGNVLESVGGIDSATISISADNNTVMGNSCRGAIFGIYVLSHHNTINGNTCFESTKGIYLSGGTNNDVVGNTCRLNREQGIYVAYGSSDNSITSNTCSENSQKTNNTYDNICVYSGSSRNNMQLNLCRKGSLANQPRYGISIANIDCEDNVVTNNDLLTSGVTGSLSDSGTGTITVAGNRV